MNPPAPLVNAAPQLSPPLRGGVDEARAQWIATFSRDRADLGPAHAAQTVADDIDRYGPQATPRGTEYDVPETDLVHRRHLEERAPARSRSPARGVER